MQGVSKEEGEQEAEEKIDKEKDGRAEEKDDQEEEEKERQPGDAQEKEREGAGAEGAKAKDVTTGEADEGEIQWIDLPEEDLTVVAYPQDVEGTAVEASPTISLSSGVMYSARSSSTHTSDTSTTRRVRFNFEGKVPPEKSASRGRRGG
eukprot:Sspe_Gene.106348::Locus_83979_Transcript_1_1_Confidence_1.000_Length_670::g.106348::m.106348